MLLIICDYCQKEITARQNKTSKPKKFRLEENICSACRLKNLDQEWYNKQTLLDNKWKIIEEEQIKFSNSLLRHKKKAWFIQRKKDFFGSFYKEDK